MMKGKRKGKDQSDGKKCPLQFPDFGPLDLNEHCPKYTAVLESEGEERIGVDDIESLQIELESLLVSVTKRKFLLEDEMQVLASWQDKKKTNEKTESESSGKRSLSEGKPNKRFKDSGKAHPTPNTSRQKSKISQPPRPQEAETPIDVPKVPKNDSPNRFWAFMEPYCAEITQDDIKMIEEWIKIDEYSSEEQKVPPLGKHFSQKWSQEDIEEEINEGSKSVERRRGLTNNSSEGEKLLKKAEKEYDSDDCSLGPLTQRLVSCLIEENLMTSLEDTMADAAKEAEDNVTSTSSKASFVKSLKIGKTADLEKRIQKELIQIGFLEQNDLEPKNGEGELLTELQKLQNALRPVVDYNNNKKKQLLELAKKEMKKQEIKKKLQTVDAEVMEVQRKIASIRQTKGELSKEQQQALKSLKEQAVKSLKERENLIKQL